MERFDVRGGKVRRWEDEGRRDENKRIRRSIREKSGKWVGGDSKNR
jgi:hypothetical protein